jgi:O-methyltransferase
MPETQPLSEVTVELTLIEDEVTPHNLYLDLMKRCLTRYVFGSGYRVIDPQHGTVRRLLYRPIRRLLKSREMAIVREEPFDPALRVEGRDWPVDAETMIGLRRLDNLQHCVTEVLRNDVPGDLIETGVWRGGATIFMRAVLKAYGDNKRTVWVADSFQGLPEPDVERYPADAREDDPFWTLAQLAVSPEQVRDNFRRYGLLDDQVRLLVGWFRDTLPTAPIDQLSLLRLDGDMYSSTMDALRSLYPKLSVGGYVIIDDYGLQGAGCRAATEDYRAENGIEEPIELIDWTGAFWKRLR